ncbi:hypothetical protein ACOXXX_20215 [Thalassococcus sp. BH17M4-6]|uniref:ATPase, T2SS/T4P/T4SS family n=1 Tax=Thalassococcus sp. BH17M4-6 TaxID=3413148 RepID=UPI003BBF4CC7
MIRVRRVCKACSGTGCDTCGGSGYAGRRVLSELLSVSAPLSQAISDAADMNTLRQVAAASGFQGMQDHGQHLIERGEIVEADVLWAIGSLAL